MNIYVSLSTKELELLDTALTSFIFPRKDNKGIDRYEKLQDRIHKILDGRKNKA